MTNDRPALSSDRTRSDGSYCNGQTRYLTPGHESPNGARHQGRLADWPSVAKRLGLVASWGKPMVQALLRTYHYHRLTPLGKVVLVTLTVNHLVKKFPAFYGNRIFITVLTKAHHWSLSLFSWNQTIASDPICFSLTSNLLSSNLPLDLTYDLLCSRKTLDTDYWFPDLKYPEWIKKNMMFDDIVLLGCDAVWSLG
jgi:hypothetical protein